MTQAEAARVNAEQIRNRTGLPDKVANGIPRDEEARAQSSNSTDDKPDWEYLLGAQRELTEQARTQQEAQATKDRTEIKRLTDLLSAVDQRPSRSGWESKVPEVTVSKLEQQIGSTRLHHGLSREQKLSALGVDPNTTDARLAQLFGGKADSAAANDLHKTDPVQYRKLREAAILLQIR